MRGVTKLYERIDKASQYIMKGLDQYLEKDTDRELEAEDMER